jgi:hypothetical protein
MPDEPSASKIVNTVKGWIAESQERKRSQRRSLTALGVFDLDCFRSRDGANNQR